MVQLTKKELQRRKLARASQKAIPTDSKRKNRNKAQAAVSNTGIQVLSNKERSEGLAKLRKVLSEPKKRKVFATRRSR